MNKRKIGGVLIYGGFFLLLGSIFCKYDISLDWILGYTPKNLLVVTLILLSAYLFKSIFMALPISVLRIAAGHLLPLPCAVIVNIVGSVLALSIPYQIGLRMGSSILGKLTKRHTKLERLIAIQQKNEKFLCYFLRFCYILPADVTTVFLGACGISYYNNLLYGLLGTLPSLLITTVLGSKIKDPMDTAFWFSAGLLLLLTVISAVIYGRYRRKAEKENI